jgi:hypothetical protein
MNAVAATDYDWRVIDSMLWQWGHWIENNADRASYPSRAAIAGVVDVQNQFSWFRVRQFTAKGHSNLIFGGHRILCQDMPERVRATNLMVNRLADEQYDAVLAKYALVLRPDGLRFTEDQQAMALDISVEAFKSRLRRARERLVEILANAAV